MDGLQQRAQQIRSLPDAENHYTQGKLGAWKEDIADAEECPRSWAASVQQSPRRAALHQKHRISQSQRSQGTAEKERLPGNSSGQRRLRLTQGSAHRNPDRISGGFLASLPSGPSLLTPAGGACWGPKLEGGVCTTIACCSLDLLGSSKPPPSASQ